MAQGERIDRERFSILVNDGVGLVKLFMETEAPNLIPAEVERAFEIPLEFR
jgi:hypothetical protein